MPGASELAPHDEDRLDLLQIATEQGLVQLKPVKPCPRCVVTTTDQDTLEKNKEPLKTLSKYRMQEGGAMFGMNVIPLGEGKVQVGMSVEVLE